MKLILITEGNPNEYGLEIVINTFGLASTYVKDGEYIIRTQKGTKAML
jgi:hypothetical protein